MNEFDTIDLGPIENRLQELENDVKALKKAVGSYDNAPYEFIWESKLDAIQENSKIRKKLAEGFLIKDLQYVEFTAVKSVFNLNYGILFIVYKPEKSEITHELVWCPGIDFANVKKYNSVPYKVLGISYSQKDNYKSGFLFIMQQ